MLRSSNDSSNVGKKLSNVGKNICWTDELAFPTASVSLVGENGSPHEKGYYNAQFP